jgi:hypothetical protein
MLQQRVLQHDSHCQQAQVSLSSTVDIRQVRRVAVKSFIPVMAHGLKNGIIELNWARNEQSWVIWLT